MDTTGNLGLNPSPGSGSSKSDVCSVRKADANTVPGDSDTSVVLKIPAQKTHDLTVKLGYDGVHEAVDYAGGKFFYYSNPVSCLYFFLN